MATRSHLCAGLALSILAACAVGQDGQGTPFEPPGPSKLALQNANFALRLYCQHLDANPDANFVLSPLSIIQGLAQIYAGAANNTAAQMRFVMQLTGDPTDVDLHRELAALGRPGSDERYNFSLASRVYLDEAFAPAESYLELLEDVYGAEPGVLDFAGSPKASGEAINAWVEAATAGRIPDALPPGAVGADTRMVLANALYFKADWASQFDKQATAKQAFHAGGEGNVTVDMMTMEADFEHGTVVERGLQVLELPYRGGRFSLLVVLPDEKAGLRDVEADFCDRSAGDVGGTFFDFGDRLLTRTVKVGLPRFTVRGALELNELLPAIGMRDLFDAELADLSGITGAGDGLYVSSASHRAFMEVNEEGTVAAASTATVVESKTLVPTFVADRPFMYYIRDNTNDALVMLGRMWDPELQA